MAGEAGDLGHHVHQHVFALAAGPDGHIAQTFAGQAQALGEGEAGQGVGVERCRVRHLFAVEGDVTVGLVADEEDVVAESLALLGQDVGQTAQGLGGVDDAGGVVRGVDEDAGDVLGQHLFKGVEIRLERRCLGRHDLEHSAGPLHIGAVLGEVGGEGQHLVAGLCHSADGVGDSARRTGGGENILLLIGQAEGLCQMGRHGGAEARVALTGAVAVEGDRLFLGQQGLHGFGELVRAGDAGVAQRVVEHVLIAYLGGALFAVHESLADDALVAQHGAVSLVQHNTFPLFLIDPLPAERRHSSAPPSPYSSIPGPAP